MQPYKADTAERYSIWEAHKHRCLWCREIVEFANLHIDHLIPQSALNRLAEIITRYNLAKDFEINDFRNVGPACAKCNLRKLEEEFEPSQELILLFRSVEKLVPEAIRVLKRLEVDDYKAKLTVLTELGSKSGQVSPEFLKELLASAEKFYQTAPDKVTEAVPLTKDVWLIRSPDKIQLYFHSLNINSNDVFSYDSPEFKAVEDGKPWLLVMHADLVIKQEYSDEYLNKVRAIVPAAAEFVRSKITPDKYYACSLHPTHLMCRILQAEGIHVVTFIGSCTIDIRNGSKYPLVPMQTLTKDLVEQLEKCYFWLRVPPFKVVDLLSWQQYSSLTPFDKRAIGGPIWAEEVQEVEPLVEHLASDRAKQQFEGEFHTPMTIEELDKRHYPGAWLNCMRRFGIFKVSPKPIATLVYAPCKIVAPDGPVAEWLEPVVGGQSPKEIIAEWMEKHSPNFR